MSDFFLLDCIAMPSYIRGWWMAYCFAGHCNYRVSVSVHFLCHQGSLNCCYRVGQKSDTFWYSSSVLVGCIKFAIFVYSGIIFIKWRHSSSGDVNKFCFVQINCNFLTMVGVTNDERCLIHSLRVEKHWGPEGIIKILSRKWAQLLIISTDLKIVQRV